MSAPESTRSKGRPSLLSETAQGAPDTSSRILASLEGRAVAQPLPRGRSKKPLVIAALAVIGFGALGAWQWQRGQQNESTLAAGTSAARSSAVVADVDKAQAAAGASGAAAAVVANASGATAGTAAPRSAAGGAASSPQTAVILADDSVRADAHAASAASPDAADGDRLARALASGTAPAQPAVAAALGGGAQSGGKAASTTVAMAATASQSTDKRASGKTVASRAERQTAKGRAAEKLAVRTTKHAKARTPATKDDADAELLAALVARTKPYDAKASRADAAKGASAGPAAKAARPVSDARHASLSDSLKACDQGNFFEAQACRWRVCSDHWGKDPACPSTASAAQTK